MSERGTQVLWYQQGRTFREGHPPGSRLRFHDRMRVECAGKLFFRINPLVFQWRPEPHVE